MSTPQPAGQDPAGQGPPEQDPAGQGPPEQDPAGQGPPEQDPAGQPGRRRYDSPVRREQAARTRRRIADAGADLVRELSAWDWRGLTFAAVAARASVGVRTVYRHFPTERDLHGAILARLQEQAGGVTYQGLALDDVARVTARVHASLSSFAVSRWTDEVPPQPALAEVDQRRREALAAAVAEATRDWPPAEQEMAAGILDVLWNLPSYERLRTAWNLEGAQATTAITWAIDVLAGAIRAGHRPGAEGALPLPAGQEPGGAGEAGLVLYEG